jgi:hypothetical protein
MINLLRALLFGTLAVLFFISAPQSVAHEEKQIRIPTTWIKPISTALSDFKRKQPKNWRCYSVTVSVDSADRLNVGFMSDPLAVESDDEYLLVMGDSGKCGPSLTYVLDDKGRIIDIRGQR